MLPDISKTPGELRADGLWRVLVGWDVSLGGCLERWEFRELGLMTRLRLLRGCGQNRRGSSIVTVVAPKCLFSIRIKLFHGSLRNRMMVCSGG